MFNNLLDTPSSYKIDSLNVYGSILNFKNQILQAWVEAGNVVLPPKLANCRDICLAGMGGSALSGRIIRSLDQYLLNIPLEIVTNYRLPAYVNQNSLVILSSYSGDTEETLSCAQDALNRKAKVFVLATGGRLAELAQDKLLPSYIFQPKFNPSNQPRMGLGYSIISVFALLSRCHFINFQEDDITEINHLLDKLTSTFQKEVAVPNNPAKTFASSIKSKNLILISANHLVGTAHAIKNMFNENSKTFAAHFDLPELDHHFLEGLTFPKTNKDNFLYIFLNSELYPKAIQRRMEITRNLIKKTGCQTLAIKPDSPTPTLQVFETLYFGQFVSYYLALINRIDPGPIPSVDYFKKELAKI